MRRQRNMAQMKDEIKKKSSKRYFIRMLKEFSEDNNIKEVQLETKDTLI